MDTVLEKYRLPKLTWESLNGLKTIKLIESVIYIPPGPDSVQITSNSSTEQDTTPNVTLWDQ